MAGAGSGRRRRTRDRLAWLRRRTWSKQRGTRLRSSSSESDGNPHPVVKPVLLDGDAASNVARKVGGGGDGASASTRPCSVTVAEAVPAAASSRSVTAATALRPQSTDTPTPRRCANAATADTTSLPGASSNTTGRIAASLSRVTTIGVGGSDLFLDPSGRPRSFRGVTGTSGSAGAGAASISQASPSVRDGGDGGTYGPNILEAGSDGDDLNYSPMVACCGCDEIRKHLVAEEGGCEGTCRTCPLSLGCCGCEGKCPMNKGCCNCEGSPKNVVEIGRGDGIEQDSDGWNVRPRRLFGGRLCVDGKGQLYVIDTEAEDSALEESYRPQVRRGRGAFARLLATTGKVALEENASTKRIGCSEENNEDKEHKVSFSDVSTDDEGTPFSVFEARGLLVLVVHLNQMGGQL